VASHVVLLCAAKPDDPFGAADPKGVAFAPFTPAAPTPPSMMQLSITSSARAACTP
jgi:hypothetical protein